MSSNPFAALDDSGDEGAKKISTGIKKDTKKAVSGGSSKPDNKPRHNDRNTKHGRGGRPPARDGKRQYDRRSGTGRGKEIKKGGGGAHNWGSDKNEAKKSEGYINEEDVGKNEDFTEGADDAEPEPEPEPDNTMTFAEYMASKGGKEENTGRTVESEFKGVSAAVKKEEEVFMTMGGGKQKKSKKKNDAKKQSIEVGFRPANPNSDGGRGRGRGGRGRGDRDRDGGGRGGGRGRRDSDGGRGGRGGRGRDGGRGRGRDGRGRGRGGRGGKPQGLNVQDESAFPSL